MAFEHWKAWEVLDKEIKQKSQDNPVTEITIGT